MLSGPLVVVVIAAATVAGVTTLFGP